MLHKKTEKGQAIILIVFAITGLIGLTALTVDGGMAYDDHRHAQNAADSAAFAAALANAKGEDLETAALDIATSNGYTDDGTNTIVDVTIINAPSGTCLDDNGVPIPNSKEITVDITSKVETFFAPVIGVKTVTNRVSATTRSCGVYVAPLFGGNAIVGLNPSTSTCAFDSGNSNAAKWVITGGGIFSNGCAYSKTNASVTLDTGECVKTVGGASNFTCQQTGQAAYPYPASAIALYPPNPCDGTAGDVGITPSSAPPKNGSVTYANGVYCISNFDDYDGLDIVLNNATLYVTDLKFDLKFAGGGGFSGTPSNSGTYSSYYMIIAMDSTPCTAFNDKNGQIINYRGNGSGTLYGTILAPSACIDFRGNANGTAVHSQIIGYTVSSNGTAGVSVNYIEEENRREPVYPSVQLLK